MMPEPPSCEAACKESPVEAAVDSCKTKCKIDTTKTPKPSDMGAMVDCMTNCLNTKSVPGLPKNKTDLQKEVTKKMGEAMNKELFLQSLRKRKNKNKGDKKKGDKKKGDKKKKGGKKQKKRSDEQGVVFAEFEEEEEQEQG